MWIRFVGNACRADAARQPIGRVMAPIEGGRRAKGAAGIGRSAGRELLGSAAVQGTTCRDWPQGWRQRRTRARWRAVRSGAFPRQSPRRGAWLVGIGHKGNANVAPARGGGWSEVGCSRRQSPRRVALATPDLARRVVAASGAGRMVRGLIWRRRRPGIPYIGLLKTVPQLA